jgi:hypothetical protein
MEVDKLIGCPFNGGRQKPGKYKKENRISFNAFALAALWVYYSHLKNLSYFYRPTI